MMGAMQKEHKLFKQLLSDTIIRICQTGLNHSGCFTVDALVGVRLDDGRVFIVNIQKSDSAAEPLHSGHSVTQVIADDDGTSLDMHVDEIVDVKQESVTFTTKERAVKNRGERRSKRLEKKHLISWKSGSSKAALKGNIKKSVVHHGNGRTTQTNNTSSSNEDTRVTDNVVDECMTRHEEKQNAVEKSQDMGVSDCDATVEGDIKEENNRTMDDSTDKAIVQLDSDEFSRYDNDAEPGRPGSGTEEGDTTVSDKAEGAKTEGDKAVVKWTCHVCGYSSAYKTNFERHLFLHGLTPNGKTHACDECGKRCRDAHELRTHVSVKHRKQLFRCARCGDDGKAFQSQKALRYHMATKHTGEFRYRCTVCDKTFLYGAHFRTHMNVHDGVRQLCPHCGKQFNYRGSLKKHMDACGARLDDDNRPIPETFRCEHCDRTFRSRSYLTDHVYTRHLGTRRYTCPTCGATFIYRTGLARHRAKCAGTAPGDGVSENSAEAVMGGSAGGRELIAGPSEEEEEEESTFVDDLLAEAGSDTNVALLSVALQGYVSHEVGQLTGRDDAASSLDVSASVNSLSTTVALTVPSSEATLTMPSSEVTLTMPSSEATLTMPASEATLIMSSSEATLSMPVFSADGLQYATSVCCQPSDRPCLVGACGASLEPRTVTQLFNNSANPALQLIDVASSHQDGGMSTVTAAPSNHAIA